MADILDLSVSEDDIESLKMRIEYIPGEGCPVATCGASGMTKRSYARHWTEVHTPFFFYFICCICNIHLKRKTDLKRHLERCHSLGSSVSTFIGKCRKESKPNKNFIDPGFVLPPVRKSDQSLSDILVSVLEESSTPASDCSLFDSTCMTVPVSEESSTSVLDGIVPDMSTSNTVVSIVSEESSTPMLADVVQDVCVSNDAVLSVPEESSTPMCVSNDFGSSAVLSPVCASVSEKSMASVYSAVASNDHHKLSEESLAPVCSSSFSAPPPAITMESLLKDVHIRPAPDDRIELITYISALGVTWNVCDKHNNWLV